MPKFRKKPVVIEAVRYQPGPYGNCAEVAEFVGQPYDDCAESENHCDGEPWMIETLEGVMEARPGDWIIKGVQGECYPCKPDIFEATYEPCFD